MTVWVDASSGASGDMLLGALLGAGVPVTVLQEAVDAIAPEPVALTVDEKRVNARSGDTVAAALIAAGIDHCRTTPVTGAPRAPYCLMGVCFECLVTIDGVGSRQGCLVQVRDGMTVETQTGRREAGR